MYPTRTEEQILQAYKQLHYLTVDQVMLATGNTSYQMTQLRHNNLLKNKYLWKIGRMVNEQNGKEKYAYTYSEVTRIHLRGQGTMILPAKEPKPHILDHSLEVNNILSRLLALERSHPDWYKLIHLEHDRDLHHRRINLPLIPDGFFELVDLKKKEAFPFLVEVDMGKEERPIWVDKTEKYLSIFGREAERVFSFRHPRILVIASEKRIFLIKRWVEETIKGTKYTDHERLFFFKEFPIDIPAFQLRKSSEALFHSVDEYFLTETFLLGGSEKRTSIFDW